MVLKSLAPYSRFLCSKTLRCAPPLATQGITAIAAWLPGMGVGTGVAVGTTVGVGTSVAVGTTVGVGTEVGVDTTVGVGTEVGVGTTVGVDVIAGGGGVLLG